MAGIGGRTRTSGQGRPKGTPNKFTRDIREMIRMSLDKAGGVSYLVRQAEANPSAYLSLVGRIIPQQIDATIKRELPNMTREDLLALLDGVARRKAEAVSATKPTQVVETKQLPDLSYAPIHKRTH